MEEAWRLLGCCRQSLSGFDRFSDHIDYGLRLRQHHHVAARNLGRRGAHALSEEALTVRLYGAIVLCNYVPARLRLPRGSSRFRREQVWSRHALGRPNQLLVLLGQIACEGIHAFLKQPETSIRDFDVRENVGLRELGRLRVGRLVGVRRKCGEVDQPGNAIVGSGAGDDASAIRVTDENGWTADSPERAFHGGYVVRGCVETVLGGNTLVPVGLKRGDYLAEA